MRLDCVLCRDPQTLSVVVSALRGCVPDDVTISHPHTSHPHSSHSSHIREEQTQNLRQCVAALRRELEARKEMAERVREREEGSEGERREEMVQRTEVREGGRREEGEFRDSELFTATEDTDFAMFKAMQSLGM